jgi:hypothetical protein
VEELRGPRSFVPLMAQRLPLRYLFSATVFTHDDS